MDRLYVSRKEGGKGHASIEDYPDITTWVAVDLGLIAMKCYTTIPKTTELEPNH